MPLQENDQCLCASCLELVPVQPGLSILIVVFIILIKSHSSGIVILFLVAEVLRTANYRSNVLSK